MKVSNGREVDIQRANRFSMTWLKSKIRGLSRWIKGAGVAWIALGLSILVWEFLVVTLEVPNYILPAPSEIFKLAVKERWLILANLKVTLWEIGVGYLISALFAVAIAIIVIHYPLIERTIMPFIVASQTIPKIAVAPLLVIWFGAGVTSKIIVIGLITFFPILINTMVGFKEVDAKYLDVLQSVAASDRQVLLRLRLPYSVPYIFAGLRVATTLSVLGAIVAEWVAASQGIGYLILSGSFTFNTARTFVGIVVLIIIGMAFFGLVSLAERLLSWRHVGQQSVRTDVPF